MITSAEAPTRPTWRFVLDHPAHFVAFGFGSGMSPIAPGTVGTLVAFPIYGLLARALPTAAGLAVVAFLLIFGVWACARTGHALGVPDYGGIVWDEIVAFLLVLYCVPQTLAWFVAGFVLFRLFDIWKPVPIRYVDRTVTGGLGVMLDDLIAAAYAILVVRLIAYAT